MFVGPFHWNCSILNFMPHGQRGAAGLRRQVGTTRLFPDWNCSAQAKGGKGGGQGQNLHSHLQQGKRVPGGLLLPHSTKPERGQYLCHSTHSCRAGMVFCLMMTPVLSPLHPVLLWTFRGSSLETAQADEVAQQVHQCLARAALGE